ncbi:AAA family ATPase [Pseudaminobacter arsenicus]|uniref:AAA family ATPase n=2 Tax=Borborobacter arsenicus TaxID=1851146 RepID=A0A432VCL2_9HYPH|nr:AAA family ATPase [Pseudaminobacter arsenicus]
MVATWNPAAASGYYLRQSDYYLGGQEPAGIWYAPAEDFGLADGASVDRDEFERLFLGHDENGSSLLSKAGRRLDRTPAFDVTLSAPRSVSLAWAFADPATRALIEDAQAKAARVTLGLLEREAAFARRGRNGAIIEHVALSAACFQHGESRPAAHADERIFADPNLHTHCVVLNMATRTDGSVGALHSKILRDWKMAAGATYHAALAAELQAIGFGIDRIGRNGIFELRGVGDDAIRYFSARRNEIEAELGLAGTTSAEAAALAAAVTRATRNAKNGGSASAREETWREVAVGIGLDGQQFTQGLFVHGNTLTSEQAELLLQEKMAALPRDLTEHESVIDRRELLGSVAASLVGTGLAAERADAEVERLLADGAVVELGKDALGLPRYSTPEMIAIEREIVRLAADLATRAWHPADQSALFDESNRLTLNAEQKEAALAATGSSAIVIVEGAPGSGKTTMLAPIVAAHSATGLRVVGAATAWRVANALRDELGIESRATASWMERLKQGRPFLDRSSVLVVDEAGLLSSREMHALLTEVHRTDAKLILVGDRRQLQAIGAGPGLDLVTRAINANRIDTIVRQREEWAREAVMAFGRGDAESALAAFADRGQLIQTETNAAALDRIVALRREHMAAAAQDQFLIIARTNAQVAIISRAIRNDLREAGQISGPDAAIRTATPSGHETQIDLAAGDRIRFLARSDRLGVVNGTTGTVTKITDAEHEAGGRTALTIEATVEGRRICFTPDDLADEKGRARLGWAYATTVYGSQGMTVDRAVVLLDPAFDRHAIHVASSRARDATTLIMDRSAIDMRLAADRPLDRQDDPLDSSEEERRKWLAERLSRAQAKASTFDTFLPNRAHSAVERRPHLDTAFVRSGVVLEHGS